jgi:antitoxin (DNA-binding transcriptional repressor) of toxin-antitoxin stability system
LRSVFVGYHRRIVVDFVALRSATTVNLERLSKMTSASVRIAQRTCARARERERERREKERERGRGEREGGGRGGRRCSAFKLH